MPSDFSEFRLGIVGGCMSHQDGIQLNQLYHRQMARWLSKDTGLRLRVAIARDFDQDYHVRLNRLLERTPLDGILLHVRQAFTRKGSLLPVDFPNGKRKRFLHPFLFRRSEFGWNQYMLSVDTGTGQQVSNRRPAIPEISGIDPVSSRKLRERLRDLNFLLGSVVGLDEWAIADEFIMFTRFQQLCQQQALPIYVLGPTPCVRLHWKKRACQKMNTQLRTHLSEISIPFTSFEHVQELEWQDLVQSDGIHLTVRGHGYVAKILYDGMGPWIREIASQV